MWRSLSTQSDHDVASSFASLTATDGVEVVIADRFQQPVDLTDVDRLLVATETLLSACNVNDSAWMYDDVLERQVLEQIKSMDAEKERRQKADELKKEEYIRVKAKEKEEREKAELLRQEEKQKRKREEEEKERKEEELRQKEEKEMQEKAKNEIEKNDGGSSPNGAIEAESELEEALSNAEEGECSRNVPTSKMPSTRPAGTVQESFTPNSMSSQSHNAPPLSSNQSLPRLTNPIGNAAFAKSTAPNIINFSDFEADSDPFSSMELKTINELQELAVVLQRSSVAANPPAAKAPVATAGPPFTSPISQVYSQYGMRATPHGYIPPPQQQQQQQQLYQLPRQPQHPVHQHQVAQSAQHASPHRALYPAYAQPVPAPASIQRPPYGLPQQQSSAAASYHFSRAPAAFPGEPPSGLKSSKSFGDLLGEIQREGDAIAQVRRKHLSRTPPPRVNSIGGVGSADLKDWTPWPDPNGAVAAAVAQRDPLEALSSASHKRICRQIGEMGFPLQRVVSAFQTFGAKGIGDEEAIGQKIINFCLTVARLSEVVRVPEADVEGALIRLGPEAGEDRVQAHLRAFGKLKDLGFDSTDIHVALINSNGDHDKALEHLLK